MDEGIASPMSFGQLWVFKEIQHTLPSGLNESNISLTVRLAASITHSRLNELLVAAVADHDALRANFPSISSGQMLQCVQRAGKATDIVRQRVQIVENTSPLAFERQADITARNIEFHLDRNYLWAAQARLTDNGLIDMVSIIASHLVADNHGLRLLIDDIYSRANIGLSRSKRRWIQPTEIAMSQRGAASEKTLVRLADTYRRIAAAGKIARNLNEQGLRIVCHVPAITTTTQLSQIGSHSATIVHDVLLALSCAYLSSLLQSSTVSLRLLSANRFKSEYRRLVDTAVQAVPVCILMDRAEKFTDFVSKMRAISWQAYLDGVYDPIEDTNQREDLEAFYRLPLRPPFVFNFHRVGEIAPTTGFDVGQCPDCDEVLDSFASREVHQHITTRHNGPAFNFGFRVYGGRVSLLAIVEPDIIGEEGVRAFTRGIRQCLAVASLESAISTGRIVRVMESCAIEAGIQL